jgi:diguanylate cyclase (GGDEF)-like protein
MREILELCIELDRKTCEAYAALAATCSDSQLAEEFAGLAREEQVHLGWWRDLLAAWETGLVPDIADEHHLLARLRDIRVELDAAPPVDCESLSPDEALELAVRFQYFMLDPLFDEVVELVQPGSKHEVRESYARHVMNLVELIEARYTRPSLAVFLAGVLRRAYSDQQRLAALAVHDQLTGLYNRRGLISHLKQWISWSWRYGRPIGIVLLDVDHFMRVNDSYGTSAGDQALVSIARALETTVRASDVIGRFGGDEFVILAPEADGSELQALMERAIEAVHAHPLDIDGTLVSLSVSAGAAWVPGGIGVTPEGLMAQADRSLYEAKASGRNRAGIAVSVCSP